jgi:hypothetical protein
MKMNPITPWLRAAFFAVVGSLSMSSVSAEDAGVLDPEAWPRVYQVGGAEVAIYMPQILEWRDFRHLKGTSAIGVKLEGKEQATFGAVGIEAETVTDMEHEMVRVGTREFTQFRFPELDAAGAAKAEELVRSVLKPETPLEMPLAAVTAALNRDDVTTTDTAVSFEPPPIFYSDSPAVLVTFIGDPKLEAVNEDDPSLMFAVNTNWDVLFHEGQYYLLADNQWLVTQDVIKGPWKLAKSVPASFKKLPDDGNWSDVKAKIDLPSGNSPAPQVFAANRPSEIIVTTGKAQLVPISGTSLMYVANTESDLFLHPAGKTYYLLTTGRWFSAASLEGPWASAMDTLPKDFAKIPEGHPKAHVLASVPGTPDADEAVILASIPQTATVDRTSTTVQVAYEGEPKFKAIPGSEGVQFATNTSYDVFLVNGMYYCCHQGVWFQAPAAGGAWIVCDNVPAPIYTIPPQSPKYNVTHVHVYNSTPTTVQVGATSGYSGAYVARGLVVFGLGMWLGHALADDDDHWHHHYYPSPYWYGYGCGAVYHHGHGYYRCGARYYGPYGGAGYGAAYNPATGIYSRGAYAYGPRGVVTARTAYNPWTNTAAGRVTVQTPYGSWGRSAVVRDDEWVRAGHHSNARGTVGGVQTSRGGVAVGVNRKYGPDAFVTKTAGGDVYVGKDGNIYKKDDNGWHSRSEGGWRNAPDVPANNPPNPPRNPPGASRPERPTTLPAQQPVTRPAELPTKPAQPTTLPAQPVTRPAQPTTKPAQPTTRPAQPSTRPAQPTTRPAAPSTRPAKPSTQPAGRPSAGGFNRGSYQNRQSTPSQLNRDAYSRSRASTASRSSSGGSRSSGGASRSRGDRQ